MGIFVACSSCHETFDADDHAGLVRCAPCEDRSIPTIPSMGATVVEFDAEIGAF
jgi:protein-arginine kinase activator protein McsA